MANRGSTPTDDVIAALVARLEDQPDWDQRPAPRMDLPRDSPITTVAEAVLRRLGDGPLEHHRLDEHRPVSIGGAAYDAVRVATNRGTKVILMAHRGSIGWWCRVFDG